MSNIENKWDHLYDPNKKTWFTKLEEKAINSYFAQVFVKKILSICDLKNGKILEPGCGSGSISIRLSKYNNDVTLFDLSLHALHKAILSFMKSSLNCKSTLGDLFHLPFRENEYDLVFNQGVMEHFKIAGMDPTGGFREMLRVLKKNGYLIILVPAYASPLHFVYSIFKIFRIIEKYWPYEDQEFMHKHELYDMMKKGGCQNIVVKRVWSSFFFSLIGYCKKE